MLKDKQLTVAHDSNGHLHTCHWINSNISFKDKHLCVSEHTGPSLGITSQQMQHADRQNTLTSRDTVLRVSASRNHLQALRVTAV